jgi:hypothetical protein
MHVQFVRTCHGLHVTCTCALLCRTIYHNLMANAARLAKSEKDVEDIARIAAGETDKVAKREITKGQKAGDVTAGLQGFVDKPRHAVG